MIFQAAFCLLLYNLIQVVRAYVAGAGAVEPAAVSTEQVFYDVRRELGAWSLLGDPVVTARHMQAYRDTPAARERLTVLLGTLWTPRWLKAPAKKHARPPDWKPPSRQGRTNVWKVLQEHARLHKLPPATGRRC